MIYELNCKTLNTTKTVTIIVLKIKMDFPRNNFKRFDEMTWGKFGEHVSTILDLISSEYEVICDRIAASEEVKRQLSSPIDVIREAKEKSWCQISDEKKTTMKEKVNLVFFLFQIRYVFYF